MSAMRPFLWLGCQTHADARGQTEDEPDFGNTLAVLSSFQLSAKRDLGFHAAESRKQALLQLDSTDPIDRASGSEFAGQKEHRGAPP
jgi:hypothetical protein